MGQATFFSLGVVLYELLSGERPFRSDSVHELLEKVAYYEPTPVRQFDERIPKELDRICAKAMSKRANERYTTAFDFADDLNRFHTDSDATTTCQAKTPSEDTPAVSPADTVEAIKVVPKGLRSFDAYDAEFFLELLPGPRDRSGVPDSIRFWTKRIEETNPDEAFEIGLIFGPSGCGKTSLVRAGIIPRLTDRIRSVYVEATAEDTERRLLTRLSAEDGGDGSDLSELICKQRVKHKSTSGEKLLIVLDQFEQWLDAHDDYGKTELARALRQCDGVGVQAVLMVRDEYWMGVSRFLLELEIPLVQGRNVSVVDLFPARHAQQVLAAFGRASGDLPTNPADDTKEQKLFVRDAIESLKQNEKVVCVRLAVFADMMRGRPWTPAELAKVGGAAGLGQTFLDETFSARSANPRHRMHQKAARKVLGCLLPQHEHDLKGAMRSREDVREASGYADDSKNFRDLMRLLDGRTAFDHTNRSRWCRVLEHVGLRNLVFR